MISRSVYKNINLPPLAMGVIEDHLLQPAHEFLSRPKKGIRAQLVELGYEASDQSESPEIVQSLADIIEDIHSGSLIVDDVQDDSAVRRTKPALHKIHGIAQAINTGNWLYFSALRSLDELPLKESVKLKLLRALHEMLNKGHLGQALDIGINIHNVPKQDVPEICKATMQLKTGELMAASVSMGAIAGGAGQNLLSCLHEISIELGFILQIYDDLKIMKIRDQQQVLDANSKDFEDLINVRPCYVWQYASEQEDEGVVDRLVEAINDLPDLSLLKKWIVDSDIHQKTIHQLNERTQALLMQINDRFGKNGFNRPGVKVRVQKLIQLLEKSYEEN